MNDSIHFSNITGAVIANLVNVLIIVVYFARLSDIPKIEYLLGLILIVNIILLLYIFILGLSHERNLLYFIQIGLMITYLIVELNFDYIFKIEFKQNMKIVIPYVMLLFAGTGGMIGIASHAGKLWTLITIISFLSMGVLSFVQRFITGR